MIKTPAQFDTCNAYLQRLEFARRILPNVEVGDVWRYFEGINLGQELSKDRAMCRPCLIFRIVPKATLVWVIPISSQMHGEIGKRIAIHTWWKYGLRKPSVLLLTFAKCIDKRRLMNKLPGKRMDSGRLDSLYIF